MTITPFDPIHLLLNCPHCGIEAGWEQYKNDIYWMTSEPLDIPIITGRRASYRYPCGYEVDIKTSGKCVTNIK